MKIDEFNISFTDVEILAKSAQNILIEKLTNYGNIISDAHERALLEVNMSYARMALGDLTGRWAVPLDTGMGKTLSVATFCSALYKLDYRNIGILICQSKVEALCEMKRLMISLGIPEKDIGIMHTYKHELDGFDNKKQLREGYASLPATVLPISHQFLLVTHKRMRGQKFEYFNKFEGAQRGLCIWDESLIASDTKIISLKNLYATASWWSVYADSDDNCELVVRYLNICIERIKSRSDVIKKGSFEVVLELPLLNIDELNTYSEVIMSIGPNTGIDKVILSNFIRMAQTPLRIVFGNEPSIVQYTVSVPVEINCILVLDASWHIRKLEQLDNSIHVIDAFKDSLGLKRYDGVVVQQLFTNAGRSSIASDAESVTWTAAEVAHVILTSIPSDQGITIFTFKAQSNKDPVLLFPDELIRCGVDLDAVIPIVEKSGEINYRPRINLLTWGMHEGLNCYAYCENIFLVGVLRQSEASLAAASIAQKGDLAAPINDIELREVINGEMAHVVFQALGRGSCRKVNQGRAHSMKAWLMFPSLDIYEILESIMLGVQWEEWKALDSLRCLDSSAQRGALRIKMTLCKQPFDVVKISINKLRSMAGLQDLPNRTFTRAREYAERRFYGWIRDKGTFYRQC